jgi:hypothetical protein
MAILRRGLRPYKPVHRSGGLVRPRAPAHDAYYSSLLELAIDAACTRLTEAPDWDSRAEIWGELRNLSAQRSSARIARMERSLGRSLKTCRRTPK